MRLVLRKFVERRLADVRLLATAMSSPIYSVRPPVPVETPHQEIVQPQRSLPLGSDLARLVQYPTESSAGAAFDGRNDQGVEVHPRSSEGPTCGRTPPNVSEKLMQLHWSNASFSEVHKYITETVKAKPTCEESVYRFAQIRFPGLFRRNGNGAYTLIDRAEFE